MLHEILEQILSYVRSAWRYRWYALGLAWLICVSGWIYVFQLPDVYRSASKVYVDTQNVLRPLLRGLTVDLNPQSQVSLMTRTLFSRPNLEKVARMTDLDLGVKDNADMDRLVADLKSKIDLAGGRENIYTVAATDKDRQLAYKLVQAVMTIFVEDTLGASRQESDTAQRFIDQQIQAYEQRLSQAEQRLIDFKYQHFGTMPGRGEGYYEAIERMRAELETAKLDLHQAEDRRDALKKQIEDGIDEYAALLPSSPAPLSGISLPIDERINALEQKLDELLLKYTERHPDVIAVRENIALLEKRRKEELAEYSAKMTQNGVNINSSTGSPVYQQMQVVLAQEDANVAAIQGRVQEYEQRLENLKKQINLVPEVESELKALNRDYGVTKSNYEQLLARRESLHMSQQVEQKTDTIRFKVIDPPQLPIEPSGPNREILMSIVLAVGLAAGAGLAFLLSQLRPTFDNRGSLMEATNIPVFGSVTMMLSRQAVQRHRIGLMTYFGIGACLLLAYAVLLVLQTTGGIRIPFV